MSTTMRSSGSGKRAIENFSLTLGPNSARSHSYRLLDHPTRLRLYEHLLLLPGDHFRSITRSLDIGVGTARHHLRILQRGGIVYERKSDGRCRYYVAGDRSQLDRNELFGKQWNFRETRIRIWTALTRHGEGSATRIAGMLGITRQLAAYHLGRLEARGLVSRAHGRYRLRGAPAVEDVVAETKRSS